MCSSCVGVPVQDTCAPLTYSRLLRVRQRAGHKVDSVVCVMIVSVVPVTRAAFPLCTAVML